MNLTSISNLATAISNTGTDQDISTAVLKKALDTETQTANELLQAVPEVNSPNLPPNLGQNIDTTA